ncbi:MAG: FG-GAP-like repeat-containing protein, partial [Candidatus Latescibacterota bacterium]|nr:FG-GAP-like repeat-containing protein [Candidatus Latescibacterota bacterium]
MAAHNGWALSAAWCDYDGDGDPDAYVTQPIDRNLLYRNRGDGTFDEVAAAAGVDVVINMGGAVWGDYDGDGAGDLLVTNFEDDYNTLYRNGGDGRFTDVSFAAGLGRVSLPLVGFGAVFLDYDNDADQDLFVANGHVYPQIERPGSGATY